MMAGIQGKNTKPEMIVRRCLSAAGVRYRLHRRDLPGAPDIVLPSQKIAIFVHGCFWHVHPGCRFAASPATRAEFWKAKLQGNVDRDEGAIAKLAMLGWRVLVVWECATRSANAVGLCEALLSWLDRGSDFGEIGAPSGTIQS
jgi:DNA mismatch endonuclease (patch repair protein)